MKRPQMDRFEDAVAALLCAVELEPGYPQARFNLALTYANNGHPREAIAQFEAYLVLDPRAADAAQVQTWVKQLQQQPEGS